MVPWWAVAWSSVANQATTTPTEVGVAHRGVEAELGHVDDHALGGDEAGGDVDDVDAGAGHLVGQVPDDPVQGPLGHGVAEPQPPSPAAPGGSVQPTSEVMFTMRPEPRSTMCGRRAWIRTQRGEGVGLEVAVEQLDGGVEQRGPCGRGRCSGRC